LFPRACASGESRGRGKGGAEKDQRRAYQKKGQGGRFEVGEKMTDALPAAEASGRDTRLGALGEV